MESGRFRYIGPGGVEHTLGSALELAEAIRAGQVLPETMLFDSRSGSWCPAGETDAFQLAVEFAHPQPPQSGTPSDRDAPRPTPLTPPGLPRPSHNDPAPKAVVRTRFWPLAMGVTGLFVILTLYWEYIATEDIAGTLGYTIGSGLVAGLFIAGARRLFRSIQPDLAQLVVASFFLTLAWNNHRDFRELRDDAINTFGTLATYSTEGAVPDVNAGLKCPVFAG